MIGAETTASKTTEAVCPQVFAGWLNWPKQFLRSKGLERAAKRIPFFERVDDLSLDYVAAITKTLSFIGDAVVALSGLVRGSARYRTIDLMQNH